MNDLDYIYADSRIHSREKGLLSDADIRSMIGMKTEEEIMDFLSSKGWGDGKQSAEDMLVTEETRTLDLISELGLDKDTLDILSYPRRFHNLKTGIQEITTSEVHEGAFYKIEGFGREEVTSLLQAREFDRLPEEMRDVAPKAFDLMLKTRDGQACDTMVDRACLEEMVKAGKRSGNKLLMQYLNLTVAATDIKIAVRSNKMGKSYTYIRGALADTELLDEDALALAASESLEALYDYLERAGFKDAVEALRKSASAFECWCDNQLIELIRPQRMVNESVGPILAYYLARENEIKTVRIILTAKANGFPESAVEERVRRMYV